MNTNAKSETEVKPPKIGAEIHKNMETLKDEILGVSRDLDALLERLQYLMMSPSSEGFPIENTKQTGQSPLSLEIHSLIEQVRINRGKIASAQNRLEINP